ncbi:MAG: hypothetical protein ACHQU1_02805 [Gemmatimonadales bacterium]
MFGFLLFVHVATFSVWLGASLTFMVWGPAVQDASVEVWANSWMTLSRVQRFFVAPSCLIATLTGIVLTLQLVQRQSGSESFNLMAMQLLGLASALLTLGLATPLANRMATLAARSLEKGARDPLAASVRGKLALVGSIAGALLILAIYFGEMTHFS